jgi:hypothetical protein
MILGGLWERFGVRVFDVDQLRYADFYAMESQIQLAIIEAENEARKSGQVT